MFPRRHRAGGSVYRPAHNLAEEWRFSGSGNRKLRCASRAVAAVRIGLILLFVGFSVEAQEDPARFLFVKKWVGTFSRSFNNTGNGTDGGCTLQWNYADSAAITAHFEFVDPKPTIAQTWTIATIDSLQAQFNERLSRICPEPTGTTEWTARAADPPLLEPVTSLIWVNAQDKTYGIAFPLLAAEWTLKDPSRTFGPQLTAVLFSTNIISLPLPDTGFALSGTLKLRPRDDLLGFSGWSSTLNSDVVVSWNIVPDVEDLEVVVELEDYATWLPAGNLKDPNEVGNTLRINARLQTKGGSTPQFKASRFYFYLLEASREPGVCMNWPNKTSADTNLDLRFDFFLNQAPFVAEDMDWIDDSTVRTYYSGSGYTEAEAMVASYDFGSYGKIKVTAEVAGRQIVGYLKGDAAKAPGEILLPKRKSDSKIADKWKEDNDVSSLADDDDSENDPVGDGHKGDGLTLYEEYRGFSENHKHVFGNPKKKDFFVCDKIDNLSSTAGIALLAAQSGLEVHPKMRPEEFNNDLSQGSGGSSFVYHSFLNFNHSGDARHIVDQHGIVILETKSPKGESRAGDEEGQKAGGTPGYYERVHIDPRFYGWTTITNRSNGSKVMSYEGAAAVAHELAHTCAVWHHGDTDTKETWQNVFIIENGVVRSVIRENGQDLKLRLEGDTPVTDFFAISDMYIGVFGGQHSGDEDCFMRYYCAQAFRSRFDDHVRYMVGGLFSTIPESPGIHLCTSTNGTGINKAQNPSVPWRPRYGDASRPNCKSQLCVNDRYMNSLDHQR